MFKLFRKKQEKKDPILEALDRNTKEIEAIRKDMAKRRKEVEAAILKSETELKNQGYTDEELEYLERKTLLKVLK